MDRENVQLSCTGEDGIELLIESYGSFFSPYAVGNVCLRSEVIMGFFFQALYT